jgi:RNA polymerase sigma-70 factor (ECF subfamily)
MEAFEPLPAIRYALWRCYAVDAPGATVQDESDEDLLARYRAGEVQAFELLLTRHRRAVYNYILRSVGGDRGHAEDLLQETFLRVIQSEQSRPQRFITWLYSLAHRLCIDASRNARHRGHWSLDGPAVGDPDGVITLADQTADGSPGTDRAVESKHLGERMCRAVERLSPEYRETFLLRELADLSFREIAEVIECPVPTVKSRMRYALEKLREELGDYRDLAEAVR